jgi:hypothetical protein
MRKALPILLVVVVVAVVSIVAWANSANPPTPPTMPAAMPNQPYPPMPAPVIKVPPIDLTPSFLHKNGIYKFVFVRDEIKGQVLEIGNRGWIKVQFFDNVKGTPWVNLNHVTMIHELQLNISPERD